MTSTQCPVPGCNSKGHLSSKYTKHNLPYQCPLFHNLTLSQCKKIINVRNDIVSSKKRPREYYDVILDWHLDKELLENSRSKRDTFSLLEYSREPLLEEYATPNMLLFFRKAQIQLSTNLLAVQKNYQKLKELSTEDREDEFCLQQLQMGDFLFDVTYSAPLPHNVCLSHMVYACEFCFKLLSDFEAFQRHMSKCPLKCPPGREIYRKGDISVTEVDGSEAQMYCRNLCLLGKLFIGQKTLLHDVFCFLFYILTQVDDSGSHFVGYFSKEKNSDFNLSCILVMPNHQKKGYGQLLIELSYSLSLAEGRLGSPERPISDKGLIAYRSFWQDKLVEFLSNRGRARKLNISDLAAKSGINIRDLISTLEEMELIKCVRDDKRIILCPEAKLEKYKLSTKKLFDSECLILYK